MADVKKVTDIANDQGLDAQQIKEFQRQEEVRVKAKNYVYPEGEEQLATLEDFMDRKFGLMVHWGLYNQMGIKESWTNVDTEWTRWQFKPGTPYKEIKEMYSKLHRGFLPLRFDAKEWAEIADDAGFKYLCFTTKHHDGFCMWDTKTTDYKVTGSEVPWRHEKNADITKELFNAFRDKGMAISLYYSRADFSCPYYWEEDYDCKVRVPSYDPNEKPEKWQKFKDYVFAQLKELIEGYGKIDAIWYDGGCDSFQLGLPEMTKELQKTQPWMIVGRGGPGFEKIITPELFVPEQPVFAPWETCTVMGKKMFEYNGDHTSFGYTYDQDYMSAKEVVNLLLDIVSKGGNLALNLAPQPDGRLPLRAVEELKVLGKWMKVFGGAIYATRPVAPYYTEKYSYTASKDGKTINVFYQYDDGETAPEKYSLICESKVLKITDLRSGKDLEFTQNKNEVTAILPADLAGREGDIADCFVMTAE